MPLEKITAEQLLASGVVSAPDILNDTAANNKKVFDRLVAEIVTPALNACVDLLNELEDAENGVAAAEATRVEAELARQTAEGARAAAEEARENAETGYVKQAGDAAVKAQSWAEGGTGTRPGEDTDNAKYWYKQAKALGVGSGTGGFSPLVEMTKADGVTTLMITDATGDHTTRILDGHTPVKGTDYFTEADKEELVEAVVEDIEAKPCAVSIDYTNWESGTFYVGLSDGTTEKGSVVFDDSSRPSNITLDGKTLAITYPASADDDSGSGDSGSGDDSGSTSETITFAVAHGESSTDYTAESGMTWAEWCESSYNNMGGFYIGSNGYVLNAGGLGFIPVQLGTDVIVAGKTYAIETPGSDMG